ncbi:MAG: hypothetical protein LUH20_00345 [Lachnospiraceae bacterium]|nr:hypothetical protein [Lachnospiraceae bacterium]
MIPEEYQKVWFTMDADARIGCKMNLPKKNALTGKRFLFYDSGIKVFLRNWVIIGQGMDAYEGIRLDDNPGMEFGETKKHLRQRAGGSSGS